MSTYTKLQGKYVHYFDANYGVKIKKQRAYDVKMRDSTVWIVKETLPIKGIWARGGTAHIENRKGIVQY